MGKRKPAESPTHHRKVQRVARELAKQGWKVKVDDVRGYDSPPEIAGRVPDIVATKPGRTRIIEVETSDSYHRNKEQLKILNRHAAQKKRTSFEVIVTKRKKSRAQTTHHRRVQREAKKLKDSGWNVRASGMRGYEEPGEIAGYVPDIIATKRGHTKIVEVETPETWASHQKQIEAFRRHAAQKPNTYFEEVITRPPRKK